MNTRSKILDIAMNLNRVGNWAADGYSERQKRIKTFLNETSKHINEISENELPNSLRKTYKNFIREYKTLEKEGQKGPKDELEWAEIMMTWGNILTHRSHLIK